MRLSSSDSPGGIAKGFSLGLLWFRQTFLFLAGFLGGRLLDASLGSAASALLGSLAVSGLAWREKRKGSLSSSEERNLELIWTADS